MNKTQCAVCKKSTGKECSHIDCPNRRPVTAAVDFRSVNQPSTMHGTGYYKRPTNKDE